jgi:hypothetical protein
MLIFGVFSLSKHQKIPHLLRGDNITDLSGTNDLLERLTGKRRSSMLDYARGRHANDLNRKKE